MMPQVETISPTAHPAFPVSTSFPDHSNSNKWARSNIKIRLRAGICDDIEWIGPAWLIIMVVMELISGDQDASRLPS